MHLFSIALLEGKLLSQKSLKIITTGKIVVPPPVIPPTTKLLPIRKYGYGFGESYKNEVRIIGHNGGAPGVDAHFYIYPTLGYTVIVLANYDRAGIPILSAIEKNIIKN